MTFFFECKDYKIEVLNSKKKEVNMKILVFDTETTGLPLEKNASIYNLNLWPHIVQLSYILFDTEKNKILIEHDWIIKLSEQVKISKESTQLHKITFEKTQKEGVSLDHALDCFDICFQNADVIVGHNLRFDKNMIMVESMRNYRISSFKSSNKQEYCTMKNSVDICKILKRSKIKPREKFYKYPTQSELHNKLFKTIPKGVHNSWVDILICLRCYYYLTQNIDLYKTNVTFNRKIKNYV